MKKKSPDSSSSTSSISSLVHSSTKCNSQVETSEETKDIDKKRKAKVQDGEAAPTKRTSIYRGVTKHRVTGRFEAHLWDKHTWNNKKTKKGRQVYLGAYSSEESAAHAYDLAALKYFGLTTILNFPVELYEKEIEEMQSSTKEEIVATLKRKSNGFSRGVSKYRGVAKHHSNGRWEARIGRMDEKKYMYLGTFASQEEAAIAYDKAALKLKGTKAVTNFDISTYADFLKEDHPHEHDTPPGINFEKQKDEEQNHYIDELETQTDEINVSPQTREGLNDMDIHEDDTPPGKNVEIQKDEEQNHYIDELGTQTDEINGLPQTREGLNDMDVHEDEMMDYTNVCGNGVEQPWSWNFDEFFDINLFGEGPHEKPGESAPFFINEPLSGAFELNQHGIMDENIMQHKAVDQHYILNKDITPSKEYRTGDQANDLVVEEEKEKENAFIMLDNKGCSAQEASGVSERTKEKK